MIQITISAESMTDMVGKLHELLAGLDDSFATVPLAPRVNRENSHPAMEITPVENPEPVENPQFSEPEKTPSEDVKKLSLVEVRAALIKLRELKGHDAVKVLLQQFGCEKAPDLPENTFADVIRKAEEAMKNG